MKTVSGYISKFVLVLAATAVMLTPVEAGSLWKDSRTGESSLVGDRRARMIGDILTVVIQETASVQASRRTETDRDSSADGAIDAFIFSPSASNFGTHNGVLPSTGFSGGSSFSGGGAITDRQSISARAAVSVIDVLPNGNLVIEGSRYVAYSGEKQYAILRGIVRPDDIRTGNTVLSSSIADARVEFLSEGTISSAQRKGWFTRLFDTINPF